MDKKVELLAKYESGVVTDAMYLLGLTGWMTGVMPMKDDYVVCGRAFTVKTVQGHNTHENPSLGIYDVLQQANPGDIIVIQCNGITDGAMLGDNVVCCAERKGIKALITDAPSRDNSKILSLNTPVFTTGRHMRVAKELTISACQVPIVCGGVAVNPGDYIVGDIDGVLVVDQNHIDEVLYEAERLDAIENQMMDAIMAGKTPAECQLIIDAKKCRRK